MEGAQIGRDVPPKLLSVCSRQAVAVGSAVELRGCQKCNSWCGRMIITWIIYVGLEMQEKTDKHMVISCTCYYKVGRIQGLPRYRRPGSELSESTSYIGLGPCLEWRGDWLWTGRFQPGQARRV
jgi:hypothetical protein